MITNTTTVQENCGHARTKKAGTTKAGTQRYKCLDCGKRFTESTAHLNGMRIGKDAAVQIIEFLCEGMSVRVAARLARVDIKTILDLLTLIGPRCKQFLTRAVRGVKVEDVQCDELWQFVYCKRRTAERLEPEVGHGGPCGDSWCHTAVDRDTKLVVAWHFGRRIQEDMTEFCRKLDDAMVPGSRFQVSTDGLQNYLYAISDVFGDRADYGQIIKIFGRGGGDAQRQYSPAPIIGTRRQVVSGSPDETRICTSHTERNNGSIRCFMKRMGRLTYCFSKKWGNHECALALHFAHFNFCRKHRGIKGKTPAMAAGQTGHVWTVREAGRMPRSEKCKLS